MATIEVEEGTARGSLFTALPTVAQLRRARVLSVPELAKAAAVTPHTVQRVERGERVTMRTIRQLAAALGVAPGSVAWPGDPLGISEATCEACEVDA